MHQFLACTVLFVVGLAVVLLSGCMTVPGPGNSVTKVSWGDPINGKEVFLFTLRNDKGVEAKISNYGGIITSWRVWDRHSKLGDVVLGYHELSGYLRSSPFFGCFVGRYANRIANAKFTLNGKEYTLAKNNGQNSLHGGPRALDKQVWDVVGTKAADGGASLELHYLSKDGEEGFPGNLNLTAVYTLTSDGMLRLDYTVTTDQDTVLSLSQHSYFNLAGAGDILNHQVQIYADKFTPVDANLIPTGELRPLDGSPLDFRRAEKIGARINADDQQIKLGGGYDHNYVLSKPEGQFGLAARVYEQTSGRLLEVWTTEPGMQFYTGNFLDGSITGKGGWTYQKRNGFCLEPQKFPDSPNQPNFPSCVLKAGETYKSSIGYKFSVR